MNNSIIYKKQTGLYVEVKSRDFTLLNKVKKVFEAALRTTLFLSLILAIVTVITSNTDYLGIKSFTVLSGSMEPTISTGSILYTRQNLGYNLRDIVTFKTPSGMTVTHRIVGISSNGEVHYTTKGDANSVADQGTITNDMIIGKTYFAIPFIGKIAGVLKDPKGLFMVVFFPAIIIVLYELWVIKKEIERTVEKRFMEKLEKLQASMPQHSTL